MIVLAKTIKNRKGLYNKYLDKIKSILFSAIVRSSISDLSGLSRLAVG